MTIEEVPSSILLIRDVSANVTDYHVHQALAQFNTRITEVRLITDQGICFVDYGMHSQKSSVWRLAIVNVLGH